jgi:uncharacterized protein
MTENPRDYAPSEADELRRVLTATPLLVELLVTVRALSLPDAYVAAGAIRSAYWSFRHGQSFSPRGMDVDVVFFDAALPRDADERLSAALLARGPCDVRWEVTNQAHVHDWYGERTGVAIAPLRSTRDGLKMWPETATCVAVRLDRDGKLDVLAPWGLQDLLALRWRPAPACPDPSAYVRRLEEKRVAERWPLVCVEP